MSEKLTPKVESKVEAPLALPTAEQAEPLRKGETDPQKILKEARQEIEVTAKSEAKAVAELQATETAPKPSAPRHVNRDLKQITLQRELARIRRYLPAPQRALSRVIHQPAVKVVSQAAGQTVSRPSGLLGGALVACLGTSGYLYLAKHLGFTYNYLVVFLLLAGGFAFGLFVELLVHLVSPNPKA